MSKQIMKESPYLAGVEWGMRIGGRSAKVRWMTRYGVVQSRGDRKSQRLRVASSEAPSLKESIEGIDPFLSEESLKSDACYISDVYSSPQTEVVTIRDDVVRSFQDRARW